MAIVSGLELDLFCFPFCGFGQGPKSVGVNSGPLPKVLLNLLTHCGEMLLISTSQGKEDFIFKII